MKKARCKNMFEKSNPNLTRLIGELKKISAENKAPVWRYLAELLEKPESSWAEVNVGKLQDYAKDHSTVIVPGKLLGNGDIKRKITVTAFKFSVSAKKKILDAGGTILSIVELYEKNPKGSGLLIMK